MTATTVRIGRYVTTAEVDYAEIGDGQQRANVYAPLTQTIIAYKAGLWGGKSSGAPSTRVGVGTLSSGAPGTLLAYTESMTPTVTKTSWDGGQSLTANLTAPLVLAPNTYALVATSKGGVLNISMRAAAAITEANENFYTKSGLASSIPTNPIGGTASNEGHMSMWLEGELNVAPGTPADVTPTGNIAGGTLTPTLTSTFSDANITLNNGVAWDRLENYQIQIIRQSDSVVMWDATFAGSSTERTDKASSRVYAGTELAYNVTYRNRVRHQDRAGAWSAWAETTFTIQSLASVDKPTQPIGFKTSTTNPATITAIYRNTSGVAANAVQARLLSAAGAVLKTSPELVKSVAVNGTISITWAESTFGTMANDTSYGVQVRARDTNNNWSLNWSETASFWMNAAPNVPTGLSPSGSASYSSRPKLTVSASDPDPEHPTSGLTVKARIKDSAGTVLFTRTMAYSTTSKKFEYQTTSTDLAGYATYKWDAYSFDGTLYSGATTTEASATKSTEATFIYAAGPVTTITGPASPIGTITPRFDWTSTFTNATQQSYTFELLVSGSEEVAYRASNVVTTNPYHVIGQNGGSWLGHAWNNGETFDARVQITDTNALSSWSNEYPVTLTLTAPPFLTLDGSPFTLPKTSGTNAVLLQWQMSTYESSQFEAYEIYRTLLSGSDPQSGQTIRIARITNPLQTMMLDAEVTSKAVYKWELRHLVRQGNDVLVSESTEWSGGVSWDGLIIHMPFDPQGHCVWLQFGPPGGGYIHSLRLGNTMDTHTPVGTGGRVAFFGPGQTADPSGQYSLLTDTLATADERYEALIRIWEAQSGAEDGAPHAACWREGRGGPKGRLYGAIASDWDIAHIRHGYLVSLELVQVGFTLGAI